MRLSIHKNCCAFLAMLAGRLAGHGFAKAEGFAADAEEERKGQSLTLDVSG
jgi:hypothetical protein